MIFISYSGRDADDADVVNRTLTAGGIATFLAPRDMIVGNYEATIVNRIRESDGMVLLLSADALKLQTRCKTRYLSPSLTESG